MADKFKVVIPDIVDAAANDVLTFNGSTWSGEAPSGGGGTATGLTFDASNATPTITQTQAASGGGALLHLISQAAATGSVASDRFISTPPPLTA